MLRKSYYSLIAGCLLLCQPAVYAAAKTYQVTGPIVEVTDKIIVVQKGDERWEIARDESSKLKGDLKVGQKVTIHYRMTVTSVEVKPGAPSTESKSSSKR